MLLGRGGHAVDGRAHYC
nr:hypothetical protein [Rhodococcus spelaei]